MFTYSLRSDLAHSTRMTEDGPEPCIIEVFSVIAERADGARWALDFGTKDRAAAEAMLARVVMYSGGRSPVGSSKWHRTAACYGSAAWNETDLLNDEAKALDMEDPNEARRMRAACGLLQPHELAGAEHTSAHIRAEARPDAGAVAGLLEAPDDVDRRLGLLDLLVELLAGR